MKTHRSARDVLGSIEQVLQPKPLRVPRGRMPVRDIRGAKIPVSPLDQVAKSLQSGRQYFAVTIFMFAGEQLLRVASAGAAPQCHSMRLDQGNVGYAAKTGRSKVIKNVSEDKQYVKVFSETRSELVTPIKIGAHVIGVLDMESDRLNAFAYQDQVLARQAATMLARYLVGPGKYVVMKAKAMAASSKKTTTNSPAAPDSPRRNVQAATRELVHAAAGEKGR